MERERAFAVIGGLLVGAAAVYFVDPVRGPGRRAKALEDLVGAADRVEGEVVKLFSREPAAPAAPESQDPLRLFLEGRVSDTAIYDRVRAALRQLSSYPEWIRATVRDGAVTLEGRVLESEVTDVIFGIRRVPGLIRLESRMDAVRNPPSEAPAAGEVLSAAGYTAARAAAGAAFVAISRPHNLAGLALVLGAGMVLAGTSGWRREGRRHHGAAQHSVEVEAPVERVFAFWSDARNLPRFLHGLQEVRETEAGVSQWLFGGSGEEPMVCNVETVELKPHRRIAWRSVGGSAAAIAAVVEFEELGHNRTRVTVSLKREIADLPGSVANPEEQLRQDLEQMAALFPAPVAYSGELIPQGT